MHRAFAMLPQMRNPVNDPGPAETATASMSVTSRFKSHKIRLDSSARRRSCKFGSKIEYSAVNPPFTCKVTEQVAPADSNDKIFTCFSIIQVSFPTYATILITQN